MIFTNHWVNNANQHAHTDPNERDYHPASEEEFAIYVTSAKQREWHQDDSPEEEGRVSDHGNARAFPGELRVHRLDGTRLEVVD